MSVTLCAPDREKSCFACCPPIRPTGYEHILYEAIVKRMLRENTKAFARGETGPAPITGFSCWAMGYLDPEYRRVGCLLHPLQNGGRDLRQRVEYGQKCRRETCPEARAFQLLDEGAKAWLLSLAEGLDSFSYSSRAKNPVFGLVEWGPGLWNRLAFHCGGEARGPGAFYEAFPFFQTALSPRAHAYLLEGCVKKGPGPLKRPGFRERFETLSTKLKVLRERLASHADGRCYTHRLDLPPAFKDFLRLHLGIRKITMDEALSLKGLVDERVEAFVRDEVPGRWS